MYRFTLIFCFIISVFSQSHAGEPVDRILAIVNDDIVSKSDVDNFEKRLRSGGLVDNLLVPDEATKNEILKKPSLLLKTEIDARLIDGEVKKQNLSVPFERVEQEIRAIARQNKMQRDDLKAALLAQGVSFSAYQDYTKTGLERKSLVAKEVTSKIKISEDDVIAALIAGGIASDSQAFEYSIAHILFLDSKHGAEGAKSRAQNAVTKLKEGVPFDRVAADFSDELNFEVGGVVGNVKTGEMPKDLEKAISKIAPGEWGGPFATEGGLRIVRLIKRHLIADPKMEEAKDRVRAQLGEKAFRRQYEIWLEQLRAEAYIHLNKG